MKEIFINKKILEQILSTLNGLPNDRLRTEVMIGLLKRGAYDNLFHADDPRAREAFEKIIVDINTETERHKRRVSNGKKGGRPAAVSIEEILEMRQNGMTSRKIAEKVGCTVNNIEKRLYDYRKKCVASKGSSS